MTLEELEAYLSEVQDGFSRAVTGMDESTATGHCGISLSKVVDCGNRLPG